LLYAWDVRGRPPIHRIVAAMLLQHAHWRHAVEQAEHLASAVAADVGMLDASIAESVDNWRPERVGVIERNIIRIGLHELITGSVPPRVAISEAVQLAHWFAGPKAPRFVNGVLDGLARRAGLL
jgi:N utilization substance protein B